MSCFGSLYKTQLFLLLTTVGCSNGGWEPGTFRAGPGLPSDGRPIDISSGRIVSGRGDRVDTEAPGWMPVIDRQPIATEPDDPSPGDWNYDVRGGTGGGTVNGAPALFASGSGHTCADRLYVPVNLDGSAAANLYAFNNLYKDPTANCAEPSPADSRCVPSANGHCPTSLWTGTSAVRLNGRLDNDGVALNIDGSQLYVNTTSGRFYVINAATGGTPAAAQTFDARAHTGSNNANFTNSTPFPQYFTNYVYTALDWLGGTRCRVYRFDVSNLQNPIFTDLTVGCQASVVFYNGFIYVGGADGRMWRVQDNGATLSASGAPWPITYNTNSARGAEFASAPTLDIQDGGQDYLFATTNDFLGATRLSTGATVVLDINGNGDIGHNINPSTPAFDFATHAVFAGRERMVRRTVFNPATLSFGTPVSGTTVGTGDDQDPYSSPVVFQPAGTNYVYIGDGGGRLNRWNATTMSSASRLAFNIGNNTDIRSPIVIDYTDGNIYFGADNGRVYQITQSQLN
jgi:hypothetical protein